MFPAVLASVLASIQNLPEADVHVPEKILVPVERTFIVLLFADKSCNFRLDV